MSWFEPFCDGWILTKSLEDKLFQTGEEFMNSKEKTEAVEEEKLNDNILSV